MTVCEALAILKVAGWRAAFFTAKQRWSEGGWTFPPPLCAFAPLREARTAMDTASHGVHGVHGGRGLECCSFRWAAMS